MKTEYLSKVNLGILLSESVIENLFNNKQKTIINAYLYKNIIDKPIYVINNDKCYGIIQLSNSDKISIEEFRKSTDKHCLTEEQRKKWWPTKQVLFSYKIKNILKKFEEPKTISHKQNFVNNFIVKDFDFIESKKISEEEMNEYLNILNESSLITTNNSEDKLSEITTEMGFQYYEFNNIYHAVEHMFKKGSSFIVEQEYDGLPCTLLKRGDSCVLYSYKKRDISSLFKNIVKQGLKLSAKDIALDCRISVKDKTQKEIKEMVDSEQVFEDYKLYVVDCLFYDSDVRNLNYRDRKQILQTLTYTSNIYETPYLFVENSKDTLSGYNIMNMMNENVVIKNNTSNDVYKVSEELSESSVTNHNYFSKQSGPMMYYLGFLSCDGYVDMSTNRIEIHISKDDSEIIKNLQKLIGDNRKITNGFLKFKSQEMVKDLSKYDMDKLKPQRKTFNKIPSQYKWDFIRGCFDADGTISESKLQFDSGNRPMVKWMYEQLKEIGGEDVKYFEYDSTSKCTVNTAAVKRVHSKIYSGSGPSLQRKKNYLSDKSEMSETTTDSQGISSIQGKKIIKKTIKTPKTLQGAEDVIDSFQKGKSLVYFLKSKDYFAVKVEEETVVTEYYKFENEDKAAQVYNKIKEEI